VTDPSYARRVIATVGLLVLLGVVWRLNTVILLLFASIILAIFVLRSYIFCAYRDPDRD
jgi:hypothetical protein